MRDCVSADVFKCLNTFTASVQMACEHVRHKLLQLPLLTLNAYGLSWCYIAGDTRH
jgi:hypothetical protein